MASPDAKAEPGDGGNSLQMQDWPEPVPQDARTAIERPHKDSPKDAKPTARKHSTPSYQWGSCRQRVRQYGRGAQATKPLEHSS